jgi:DNA polymerase-3 subunit alpha
MLNNFLSNFNKYKDVAPEGIRLPDFKISDETKKEYSLPDKIDNIEFFKILARNGWREKQIEKKENKDEYIKRVKREIELIVRLGYVNYFLIIWDIVNFCDKNDIPRGPGRGSCAGSIITYLLGITSLDPIKYDLIFERFISESRAASKVVNGITYLLDSPDVDLDIDYVNRPKVVEYLNKKYENRTCKILTISTLTSKAALREAGKIVGCFKESEIGEITSLIPLLFNIPKSLEDSIKEVPKFAEWAKNNEKVMRIAKKLDEINSHFGVHASGYVVNYCDLNEIMPTQLDKEGSIISGYTMGNVSEMSVKVDLLGLKTLSVINDTCKQIGIKYVDLLKNPNLIDVEDSKIYDCFQDLKYKKGIFQIEADVQSKVTQKVKPKNLDEVSAVIALARPGAISFVDQYVKNEQKSLHPLLDKILSKTHGVSLFQEQMMQIANQVFGFSLTEANTLRKIVGKKQTEKMPAWKERVYEAAKRLNLGNEVADLYWKILNDSANYSFNISHSASYGLISVWTAYLKFKYPQQFFLALLRMSKNEQKPFVEISEITQELPHFDIKLLPPDMVKSEMDFSIEGKDIRCGLSNVKGISDKSFDALRAFRNKEYPSKFEMFIAAKEAGINIGAFSALIQAGALSNFDISNNRPKLVLEAQTWNLLSDTERRNFLRISGETKNYDLLSMIKKCIEEKALSDRNKILITEKRFGTIKKTYDKYKEIYKRNSRYPKFCNYFYEKKLLGFNHSVSLLECFPEDTDLRDTRVSEELLDGERATIVGTVTDVYKGKAKSSGKQYMKIAIEDEYGKIQFLMGERSMQRWDFDNHPAPKEDDIVYCIGTKSKDIFFLDSFENFEEKIYLKLSELK